MNDVETVSEAVTFEAVNFEIVECAQCEGEGHVLHLGAASIFSGSAEAYLPAEGYMLCPLCHGEGEIEVCSQCREPFEIVGGREVCACAMLELPKAA